MHEVVYGFRFNKTFSRDSFAEILLSLPKVPKSAFFWRKPSEHDNGVRFSFILQVGLSLPQNKKQPFCSTVIYSSMLSLTDCRERTMCFSYNLYRKIAAVHPSTHRYFVYPKVTTVTSRFGSSATVSPTVASRSVIFSEGFYG